jgi:hypothetical protein
MVMLLRLPFVLVDSCVTDLFSLWLCVFACGCVRAGVQNPLINSTLPSSLFTS